MKCLEEEQHYFTVLQISLMFGLREDSWILMSVSAFNSFQSVLLVGVHLKKSNLTQRCS